MSKVTVYLALLLFTFVAISSAQRRPHPERRGYHHRRGPGDASILKNRKGPGNNGRFFDPRKPGPFKQQKRKPFKPFIERQFRLPNKKQPQLEYDLSPPPPPLVQRPTAKPKPTFTKNLDEIISIEELNRPRRQPDTFTAPFEAPKKERPSLIEENTVPRYEPSPSAPISDVAESRDTFYIPSSGSSGPAYEENSYAPPEQRDLERAIVGQADAYQVNNEKAEVYQKEDRLEFQIHGHEGPNSYRYGYDTGNGYNRQFRYEEKDKNGIVNGRYGYFDPYGKLHVVNYSSHPEHGYKASGDGLPTL